MGSFPNWIIIKVNTAFGTLYNGTPLWQSAGQSLFFPSLLNQNLLCLYMFTLFYALFNLMDSTACNCCICVYIDYRYLPYADVTATSWLATGVQKLNTPVGKNTRRDERKWENLGRNDKAQCNCLPARAQSHWIRSGVASARTELRSMIHAAALAVRCYWL